MDQAALAAARTRRDKWLRKRRNRSEVPATSDVLWDVYHAALQGLDLVFVGQPNAAALKLAEIVQRVEQHNVAEADNHPRPNTEVFKELSEVIGDV